MQRPPSETVKPELVVHAGIPKCATSSLQMLMIKQDFAVTRDLGLVWIGRGIRLWGPGVAVSEMMYDPGGTVDQIEALDLDPEARYFMSSEALSGTMEVFEALSRRFEISRVILSVRLPILTALSAYCYSGWLSQTPDEVAFAKRHAQIVAAIERVRRFGPVILCPTEPEGLAGRFIRAVSGDDAPHLDPEQSAVGRANRSVPPALAIMMNKVMQEEGIGPILGPHHARFTTVARNNPGRPRFREILPEPFATVFRDIGFCDAELKKYEVLLREANVAEPHVAEAVAHAQAQLAAMREMPTHDPQMTEILRYRARWNLARVQKLHPEAFDASAPDLGRYPVPLEEALGG